MPDWQETKFMFMILLGKWLSCSIQFHIFIFAKGWDGLHQLWDKSTHWKAAITMIHRDIAMHTSIYFYDWQALVLVATVCIVEMRLIKALKLFSSHNTNSIPLQAAHTIVTSTSFLRCTRLHNIQPCRKTAFFNLSHWNRSKSQRISGFSHLRHPHFPPQSYLHDWWNTRTTANCRA